MWSRIQVPERALSLLIAAAIFGAMLGEPGVLCIEPDGRSHRESLTEDCCSLGDASLSRAGGAELQAEDAADCGDCRDVIVAAKLAWRPVERGTSIMPAPGPLAQLDPPLPLTASSFCNRGQDPSVAPVLLALRTVIISC